MCGLLKISKCKLIPVYFFPTNITTLGKYFFPLILLLWENISLSSAFLLHRSREAAVNRWSLISMPSTRSTGNPHKSSINFFSPVFTVFEQQIRVIPLTSDKSPDWDVIAWWQSSYTGSVWMAGVILAALSPVPP